MLILISDAFDEKLPLMLAKYGDVTTDKKRIPEAEVLLTVFTLIGDAVEVHVQTDVVQHVQQVAGAVVVAVQIVDGREDEVVIVVYVAILVEIEDRLRVVG